MPLPIVILVRTIGPRYPDDLGQVVGQTPQKFQLSGEAFFGLLRFDHGCLGGGALLRRDNPLYTARIVLPGRHCRCRNSNAEFTLAPASCPGISRFRNGRQILPPTSLSGAPRTSSY